MKCLLMDAVVEEESWRFKGFDAFEETLQMGMLGLGRISIQIYTVDSNRWRCLLTKWALKPSLQSYALKLVSLLLLSTRWVSNFVIVLCFCHHCLHTHSWMMMADNNVWEHEAVTTSRTLSCALNNVPYTFIDCHYYWNNDGKEFKSQLMWLRVPQMISLVMEKIHYDESISKYVWSHQIIVTSPWFECV